MGRASAVGRALAAVALLVGGCGSGGTPDAAPSRPVRVDWRQVNLPVPAGTRIVPRDAARCFDVTYLVGAVASPDGATRPAAWRSADGVSWTSMPFRPKSFYGEQNVVYSVACGAAPGQLAVIGAKTGGVHGNPRVSTWYLDAAGEFQEVLAGLEQYGGNEGINAARMAGGPAGYLIAGNRTSGAAVWLSPDAHGFELVEKRPTMTNEGPSRTTATDAVATTSGWLVVGGELRTDRQGRDPAVWISGEGRDWSRVPVPAADEDEIMMRVVAVRDGFLAAGTRGARFGVWRERQGRWEAAGVFGESRGAVAAGVGGVAVAGDRAYLATSWAGGHQLWRSGLDGREFRPVEMPAPVPAGGTSAVSLSAIGGSLLLLTDDGRSGGVWLANSPVG